MKQSVVAHTVILLSVYFFAIIAIYDGLEFRNFLLPEIPCLSNDGILSLVLS